MMLSLLGFDSLVAAMAAAVQGRCGQLIDLSVGSVCRALLEAQASVALWIQWLIVRVLQTTRAATSTGSDLDSWVADFGLVRLPGVAASGVVTLARFVTGVQAVIPAGTLVRTPNGSQVFMIFEDPTHPAWNDSAGGYLLAAGVSSLNVPARAQTAGVQGNVQPGTITLLGSAIPGVDGVHNDAAFAGGADAESDVALRARFSLFMDSRSKATVAAIQNAIVSTQQGLRWLLTENEDPSGARRPGFFTITLDDGSGAPPPSLLTAVSRAVDAVRPIGTMFAVVPPVITNVTVHLSLEYAPAAPSAVVQQSVVSAISQFINALPMGAGLPVSRLAQLAYDADPGVLNVTNILVNGNAVDLPPRPSGELRAQSVTVG